MSTRFAGFTPVAVLMANTITKKTFVQTAVPKIHTQQNAHMTLEELQTLKGIVVIMHEGWALSPRDRWMWTALYNTDIRDYHKPTVLIAAAERDGLPWMQVRISKKKGTFNRVTIVKRSK